MLSAPVVKWPINHVFASATCRPSWATVAASWLPVRFKLKLATMLSLLASNWTRAELPDWLDHPTETLFPSFSAHQAATDC